MRRSRTLVIPAGSAAAILTYRGGMQRDGGAILVVIGDMVTEVSISKNLVKRTHK